jgi:carboxyl-terminal processing protease
MKSKVKAGFILLFLSIVAIIFWSYQYSKMNSYILVSNNQVYGDSNYELQRGKDKINEYLNNNPEIVPKVNDLLRVISRVQELYVDPKTQEELLDLAMKGSVEGLDPNSSLMMDDKAVEYLSNFYGEERYCGIGIVLMFIEKTAVIYDVVEDSPAKASGLLPGDIILKIDGTNILNLTQEEISKMVKGDEGTIVNLEIYRKGSMKPMSFNVRRQPIVVPSVFPKTFGDVGYIRINRFNYEAVERVRKAITDMRYKRKLIIDLRDNPGGFVESTRTITGYFIGWRKLILTEVGKDGVINLYTNMVQVAHQSKALVLINGNSASSSEILAGNLQYYQFAKVLGEKSYGKATVQGIFNLSEPDSDSQIAMRLTVRRYILPGGLDIGNTGIKPDINVAQPEGFVPYEYLTERDLQFQKALEYLRK